jgi:hypothetical protein
MYLSQDVQHAMKIDFYKGQMDEYEYSKAIGVQLVYLNKSLFQKPHSEHSWSQYKFPCIRDDNGNLLEWDYRYSERCILS